MPKFSTPNLCYYVNDENGRPKKFADVEKALALAARSAFDTEKTTSMLVYNKDRRPGDEPLAVLYVKVTLSSWE